MPQALEQSRQEMRLWFGDIDASGPLSLLALKGFTEKAGLISPPVPSHTLNYVEQQCICFLLDEWDFEYEPFVGAPTIKEILGD